MDGTRTEDFRFPKEKSKRQALAEQIGGDGWNLLALIQRPEAAAWLREVPAVQVWRRVWLQQYGVSEDTLFWRSDDNIPPASLLISSPSDPDAHRSIKRSTVWTGYKVHLTETCDEEAPHVVIHVETTAATTQDSEMTDVVHQAWAQKHFLPGEHLADAGYGDGPHLVKS